MQLGRGLHHALGFYDEKRGWEKLLLPPETPFFLLVKFLDTTTRVALIHTQEVSCGGRFINLIDWMYNNHNVKKAGSVTTFSCQPS